MARERPSFVGFGMEVGDEETVTDMAERVLDNWLYLARERGLRFEKTRDGTAFKIRRVE